MIAANAHNLDLILLWGFLMMGVMAVVGFLFVERVGKGRIFSRPLWRFRLFRPYISPWTGKIYAANTRLVQILLILPTQVVAGIIWPDALWRVVFYALVICLYLDDYATGDDERWRRFKDRVRNTVKWRMVLPKMAPDA